MFENNDAESVNLVKELLDTKLNCKLKRTKEFSLFDLIDNKFAKNPSLMALNSFLKIFLPKDRVFYNLFESVADELVKMAEKLKEIVYEPDFEQRAKLIKQAEEQEAIAKREAPRRAGTPAGTLEIVRGGSQRVGARADEIDPAVAVDVVKPAEGATGWSDTWMINSKTKSRNCAYKFLNHITSAEVNIQIAEYFGEAPANSKSCALAANPDHCKIFHAEETDYWKNVWYWTTPTEKCLDGRTDVKCMDFAKWVEAWTEIRAG